MAVKGYTDKTAIENYILQEIDEAFLPQLDLYIGAAEKIIDNMTNRSFVGDAEESERLFDGDDTESVLIDEAIEITKVEVAADDYGSSYTEIADSGYNRYFTEGTPIRKVMLNSDVFPRGRQTVRITAKWGYSEAVPDDIKFAATVFVAGILNGSRQGGDQIKSEHIGNYTITYNSDVGTDSWSDFEKAKSIVEAYRRIFI